MLAMREVRAIYRQGGYAVAAAFRQLYEMIEVEDERVRKLVAAATWLIVCRSFARTAMRCKMAALALQYAPDETLT